MKSIPERWQEYSNVGRQIEGTQLIAFKTPLKEMYNGKLKNSERFTPTDLLSALPNLGLIIDLTATDRYYNPQLLAPGVSHVKLKMEGRVLPSEIIVKRFKQIITDFLQDTKNASLLVGVHCTHGVNRTGYMICRYLVDCLKVPADDAIKRFAEARGYPIEREVYTKHLQKLPIDCDEDDQSTAGVKTSWLDRDQEESSIPYNHHHSRIDHYRRQYEAHRLHPQYTTYSYNNQYRSYDRRYDQHHENWRSREDSRDYHGWQPAAISRSRYRWERQPNPSRDRRSWHDERSRSPRRRAQRSWRDECRQQRYNRY